MRASTAGSAAPARSQHRRRTASAQQRLPPLSRSMTAHDRLERAKSLIPASPAPVHYRLMLDDPSLEPAAAPAARGGAASDGAGGGRDGGRRRTGAPRAAR